MRRTLLILAALLGCSRGDADQTRKHDPSAAERPRPTVVSAPAIAYRVVPVADPGSISGTVDFDGVIPPPVAPSDPSCGTAPSAAVVHAGTRIGGVLVWLTDIRSGKALPGARRFELMNDHCTLDPHVQVILSSSTLNVASEDRVQHLDRFIDVASGQTIALAPFNDEGEVVPLDHSFVKPAEIEVVCDLHPSSHAWIAVLDHPYYSTTTAAGAFSMDSVPAGRYHIRAWHPTLGILDDSVTVLAGKPLTLALKLSPKNFEAESARRPPQVPGGGFSAPKPSPSDSSIDSVRGDTTGGVGGAGGAGAAGRPTPAPARVPAQRAEASASLARNWPR